MIHLMTTQIRAEDIERAAREILGADAKAQARVYPTGAVSLDVHRGGHHAVIEHTAADGWAASADPSESEAFTGHQHVAETLQSALEHVRDAWAGRAP